MAYFKNNEIIVPKKEDNAIPKGRTFSAKFIAPGLVGYKNGNYFLSEYAMDCMAGTLKGCPVVIGHQDIADTADMEDKAVGYVCSVRKVESGWYCDFVVFDKKALSKLDNKEVPYVSCAYRADLSAEGGVMNNIKYVREITGGTMLHLALVKNPRYNGTDVWENSADDKFVGESVLFNEKESKMKFFKKSVVDFDNDVIVDTPRGERTIEQLANEIEEMTKSLEEANAKISAETERATKAEEELASLKAEVAAKEEAAKVAEGDDKQLKADLANSLGADQKEVTVIIKTLDDMVSK